MAQPVGKRVKVQRVTPADLVPVLPDARDLCAEVCFYFPAYKLEGNWSGPVRT